MKNERQFLITVGTTKFESLISSIDKEELYEFLDQLGFTKLIIQKGSGIYEPSKFQNIAFKNLKVEVASLLSDFEKVVSNSEYIISHGGAGNILEALKYQKKIFVVVNDLLMDNHQVELAESLCKDNYIFYIRKVEDIVKQVRETLVNENNFKLRDYPDSNYDVIPNLIYEMLDI